MEYVESQEISNAAIYYLKILLIGMVRWNILLVGLKILIFEF